MNPQSLSRREAITLAAAETEDAPTQVELARRFGVYQSTIARRLASARRKKYGSPTRPAKTRIRPFSLLSTDNI